MNKKIGNTSDFRFLMIIILVFSLLLSVVFTLIPDLASLIFIFWIIGVRIMVYKVVIDGFTEIERSYSKPSWITFMLFLPGLALIMAWVKIANHNKMVGISKKSLYTNYSLEETAPKVNQGVKREINSLTNSENNLYIKFARIMQKNFGRVPGPDSNEFRKWIAWNN